jgi:hypothetical protein
LSSGRSGVGSADGLLDFLDESPASRQGLDLLLGGSQDHLGI